MSSSSDYYGHINWLSNFEENSYLSDNEVETSSHNYFPNGQFDEIKKLALEIKSLSDKIPTLKKDIQLYNDIFDAQEENLNLKAELKALKSQQYLSTNNSDDASDNNCDSELTYRLKNEVSSLKNQLDFQKDKMSSLLKSIEELKSLQLESKLTIDLEEYAAILSKINPLARSWTLNHHVKKNLSINNNSSTSSLKSEPRMGVYQITNIKLSKSKKENVKPMMIVKNIKEKLPISAIFDENAYISICGPFILNYKDKDVSLKPAPYIDYKFHSGKVYKCLGSIEINLINSLRGKKCKKCTIYIFNEANILILNKLHWKDWC
uniref:Uncharacterized protein n=1 Tax=Lepeophtheirus salmonis TaxID=72036 RepID=A0A0K2UXW0_LEPSM